MHPMVIIISTILLCHHFLPSSSSSGGGSICSSSTAASCPPLSAPLSFPFAVSSASQGCGHPAFQVDCARSPSLTINNFSFSLPQQPHPNRTILLSPDYCDNITSSTRCPHCALPLRPVNLSASPFRFSSSACSRLSAFRPCNGSASINFSSPSSNCSLTRWQRRLLLHPALLIIGCRETSTDKCSRSNDVAADLREFLQAGIEVEWKEDDDYFRLCNNCQSRGGACGFNHSDAGKPFLCFQGFLHSNPSASVQSLIRDSDQAEEKKRRKILIGVCSTVVALCFLVTFVVVLVCGYISREKWKLRPAMPDEGFLLRRLHHSIHHGSFKPSPLYHHHQKLPPIFTYEELDYSTNSFDQKRKLGDGGFGSVYLGQLKDGRVVAVKKLYRDPLNQDERATTQQRAKKASSFVNEILILSSLEHPNLVRLHGYCTDPRGLLLVYEFVANGTLADHLHGHRRRHRGLSWHVRLSIALQIGQALEYLHFGVRPPVVHRDITSSNIFLTKDFGIKVGDFGLSRLLHPSHSSANSAFGTAAGGGSVWTGPQGTPGYLDPDYHRSFLLTEKSDVYSFGVVLLELISGRKAVDTSRERREMGLADLMVSKIQVGLLMEVVDPELAAEKEKGGVMGMVRAVAELAFRCVAGEKDDRPDMREVVEHLKRIRTIGGGGGVVENSV
ncbi:putative serine/threonine-protein kinase [Nymphaea thermarum]|nr:putative serine/threonine-protein kinase [Nymphaea thermarum]